MSPLNDRLNEPDVILLHLKAGRGAKHSLSLSLHLSGLSKYLSPTIAQCSKHSAQSRPPFALKSLTPFSALYVMGHMFLRLLHRI